MINKNKSIKTSVKNTKTPPPHVYNIGDGFSVKAVYKKDYYEISVYEAPLESIHLCVTTDQDTNLDDLIQDKINDGSIGELFENSLGAACILSKIKFDLKLDFDYHNDQHCNNNYEDVET